MALYIQNKYIKQLRLRHSFCLLSPFLFSFFLALFLNLFVYFDYAAPMYIDPTYKKYINTLENQKEMCAPSTLLNAVSVSPPPLLLPPPPSMF